MLILRRLGIAALAVLWTVAAACLVLAGLIGSIDTSCDGPPQRDMAGGGWLVIGALSVWSAAFVTCAIILRTWGAIALASVAVGVALLVMVTMLATAPSLCW
jgi:hypothetical protein